MNDGFRLFPEQASTFAGDVDLLFAVLVSLSLFFAFLIFFLIYIFAVRYRRRSEDEMPRQIPGLIPLEVLWMVVPFGMAMVIFVWGVKLYFDAYTPPENAMEIYVVGKQWMWHIQHPTGQREINALHVPVGRPVKLILATEDVIHSFFVPAFRVKQDVVPGRYTYLWFEANKVGDYHLFCAEYCGTKHSEMTGRVVVMEPADYQRWLSGEETGQSLTELGEKKFNQLGCANCHGDRPNRRGPSLVNIFGKPVQLRNGQSVMVDESYIRESILKPNAKITAGYKPVMPTYQGQISEAGLLQITAYIKSLTSEGSARE